MMMQPFRAMVSLIVCHKTGALCVACPACSDALADSRSLGAGINYSTIGLVFLTFIVVAIAALVIRRVTSGGEATMAPETRHDDCFHHSTRRNSP